MSFCLFNECAFTCTRQNFIWISFLNRWTIPFFSLLLSVQTFLFAFAFWLYISIAFCRENIAWNKVTKNKRKIFYRKNRNRSIGFLRENGALQWITMFIVITNSWKSVNCCIKIMSNWINYFVILSDNADWQWQSKN